MSSSSPLHSANWYRVASLHPNMQPGTQVQRQMLRGQEWFLFTNPVTQAHYRLNRKAYELIARFDGKHSIDQLWNGLLRVAGDDTPTQDEVIAILIQLMESGLILFDSLPVGPMFRKKPPKQKKTNRLSNLNPFSFTLRLFDPSRLLRSMFWMEFLAHPLSLLLIGALGLWALVYASLNWVPLTAYASIHLLTPRCLLFAWLFYPFIKAAHELGHGLMVQHFGGRVREFGVAFFLLVPTPYVDASAATAFPTKWQRIAVSSAGIAVELVLASLALIVWSITEDGFIRDAVFVVMAIGSLSTIVFNGNPLLRLDGYHILSDFIELPNLGIRSQRLWVNLIQRYIKGLPGDRSLQIYGKEYIWLTLYAPAAWIYRIVITVAIIGWIGSKSAFIAFLALLWMAFSILGKPLWEFFTILRQPVHPGLQRWQPLIAMAFGVALVAGFLFVPLPESTVATGVVWLPEQSQLRASSNSQVVSILAHDGERVTKGQPLIVLSAPDLQMEKKRLIAQIVQAEADQANGWLNVQQQQDGKDGFEKVKRLNSDLAELQQRIDELNLKAEVNGTFVLPHPDEKVGNYLPKGAVIAYVVPDESTTIRAAVPQDEIGLIREKVNKVSVLLDEDNTSYGDATLVHVDPAATTQLPNKALGDLGGGSLVTDHSDKEGLTLLDPVFLVDVQIPERKIQYVGGRAVVHFRHDARPLAAIAVWHLKQLFLKLFAEKQ